MEVGEEAQLDLGVELEAVPTPDPLQSGLHAYQIVASLEVEGLVRSAPKVRAAQGEVVGQVEIADAPQPREVEKGLNEWNRIRSLISTLWTSLVYE